MKRRDFSASLAAGSILAGSGISASAATNKPVALPQLQKQAFEARLDQPFSIQGTTNQTRIKAQLKAVDTAGKGEQFFVRFDAAQAAELTEDIYLLTANDGQEVLLHMQPSASDKNMLEAVINLHTG